MADKERQRAQARQAERSQDAGQGRVQERAQAKEQQRGARQDHGRDAALVHERVQGRMQEAQKSQGRERQAATERQQDRRQELAAFHAAPGSGRDAAQTREADASMGRFQQGQQKQLEMVQGAERDLLRQGAEAASQMQRKHESQRGALERLAADPAQLQQSRERLELRQASEVEALRATLDQQAKDIARLRAGSQMAMERDEGRMLDAVYQPDAGRRKESMQEALAEQQRSTEKLQAETARLAPAKRPERDQGKEKDGGQRRQDQDAGRAREADRNEILDQSFTKHAAIRDLWNEAAKAGRKEPDLKTPESARKEYDNAMKRFVGRLTQKDEPRAQAARAIFEKAGFEFAKDQDGSLRKQLPTLRLQDIADRIDKKRHMDLLRVSGQHVGKIEDPGSRAKALDADNLRFMLARDNMQMDVRGAQRVRDRTVEEWEKEQRR